MNIKSHFELMAAYNQWMNSKVYEVAGELSAKELAEDRGAYFGSILGTLNHILVADIIWLKRFATHPSCTTSLRDVTELPSPRGLDQVLFGDLTELSQQRFWLDRTIIDWTASLSESDLDFAISYRSIKGGAANKEYASLILHFFNHQTHHRGQVSTLMHQAGKDIGVTDLLALIPQENSM